MLKKSIIKSLILLFAVLSFTSCEVNETTNVSKYNFTVQSKDWQWNDYNKRFECTFDFPELTNNMYENGAISGSVFINQWDNNNLIETQRNLPYSFVYNNPNGYVESVGLIHFDVTYNPKSICFYLETYEYSLRKDYTFKITVITKI